MSSVSDPSFNDQKEDVKTESLLTFENLSFEAPKEDNGNAKENGVDAAKKAPASGGRKRGYTRPYKLSKELAEMMGQDEMPRHEVVRKIWAIIKERNLYDPQNRQFAICDEQLLKIFGVQRFRTFGMMKYLKLHFFLDKIPDSNVSNNLNVDRS